MKRLQVDEDIKPLSEFRATVTACLKQVHTNKRPLVITQRGRGTAVLMDVGAYEDLMGRLELLQGHISTKLEQAVQLLRGEAKKIILFGSHARGQATSESDIDLLILKDQVKDRVKDTVRLRRLLSSLRIPIDLIVATNSDFEKWSTTPGNLMYEIATEGKILYEKS